MSATNEMEGLVLSLIFENAAAANIGDAAGLQPSGAAGNFYISLHTADPGEGGSQTTSECAYTGYARVAVARGVAQWTVSGTAPTQVVNDNAVTFPASTSGPEVATHFGIGSAALPSAGHLFFSAALTAPLTINNGITPSFAAGLLKVTCD